MNSLPRRLRPEPLAEVSAVVDPLRAGFLALHKALLDGARASHEAHHGALANNMEFLQKVLNDEEFAWLRPFSQFIIELDEALEEEPPRTLAGLAPTLEKARRLLRSSEGGTPAEQRLFQSLASDDNVVYQYAELRRLLNQN